MAGARAQHGHVVRVAADIGEGEIGAIEPFDMIADKGEQRRAVEIALGALEHGDAAAKGQAGERVLVAHRTGEAEGIGGEFGGAVIMPEAAAARRRAERGGVDDGGARKAALFILDQMDLLGQLVRTDKTLFHVHEKLLLNGIYHRSRENYLLFRPF